MDYLFTTILGAAAGLAIMLIAVGIYDAVQASKEDAEIRRRRKNGRKDRGNTEQDS